MKETHLHMCTSCHNSCYCYNHVDKVIIFLVSDLMHIHFDFIHVHSLQNHAETLCALEAEQCRRQCRNSITNFDAFSSIMCSR
jgi:hypothetical protein